MVLLLAIIIIVVIFCIDKSEKEEIEEEENKIVGYNTTTGRPILKKYVNITGQDPRTGQPLFEYKKNIIGYNPNTGEPVFEGEEIPKIVEEKRPLTEEEKNRISNSILIIAGAILVVIASIIFLATGWETMHGFVKTIILVGIQLIFYGFGYISNEKLNIPKIGKMFNYLTLAFVPVVIMSLSFFELVGEFLSIGGEGFVYYIGFSLLVSDFIFKYYGKVKNEIFVKRSSLILEIIAILLIVNKIEILYIEALALAIHTIIIYILLQGGYLDNKAYNGMNYVYSIFLIFVIGIPTLSTANIISFASLIILSLGFFIRCLECKDESNKRTILIYFLISYLLSIRIIEDFNILPYFLYLLALLPIIGLTKVINSDKTKNNILIVVGMLTMVITIISLFNHEQTIYYLLTYVMSFIISIIVYIATKVSIYKLWSYISFNLIFFALFYITNINEVSEYIIMVTAVLVYAIELVFEKLKDKTSLIFILGSFCLATLLFVEEYTLLIPLVLMTLYLLLEKKKNLLLIPMIASILITSLDNRIVVDTILGILTIIYIFASISVEEFNRYSLFSLITIICLCIDLEISAYVFWTLILIWGVIHYVCKTKENNEIYVSAIVLSIFGLYTKTLIDIDSPLYANYALGIILLSICMTKGVLKKLDKEFLSLVECGIIGCLTIFGAIIIKEPIDGVAYLGILLVVSILSYTKEWKTYLYSSIISMIFGVIVLTAEYWKELPWYVYILVIGLALISFAMYDEKRKQTEKEQEEKQLSKEQQDIEQSQVEIPDIEQQPVTIPTIDKPIEEEHKVVVEKPSIKLQIVEDTSIENSIKIEEQKSKQTGTKKSNKEVSGNKQKNKR